MSLVDSALAAAPAASDNAAPYSVSELAFALKRTLEDAYGFVRLRGEISKVTRHASGHVYLTLKDEKACLDAVIWKGSVRALKAQPEQGLEVIATGRITTYPARSAYQMVIETLEPAGVGALLAQLERLKLRLREEGLFEAGRKRPLPSHPAVVGVVTSPTGAVIRDILHRIMDRWPAHVIVWPVVVQGEQAAAQVAAAIAGFNALAVQGPIVRPDVLIVARGGGSIEDLWPFNDEALARAAAASAIPLISAVGHETDTTLIDFVSDRRAPTPTAAAEIATPVLSELRALVLDYGRRTYRCAHHQLDARRTRLSAATRGLARPADLLALATQRFDLAASRLASALERNAAAHAQALTRASARLMPTVLSVAVRERGERLRALALRLDLAALREPDAVARRARLPELGQRMQAGFAQRLRWAGERLGRLEQLRVSLNPDRPLALGFARIHHAEGQLARAAGELTPGETVSIVFADKTPVRARIETSSSPNLRRRRPSVVQGDLF